MLHIHQIWAGQCPLLGQSLYVWVQGCPRRCPGCFNEAALPENGPALWMSIDDVVNQWRDRGGGLVLSGGEPFAHAGALAQLCQRVRAIEPETPVLTYTGYVFDELISTPHSDWVELLRQTDVLVDGPFMQERKTDSALMGSDNQRVFFLTERVPSSRLGSLQSPRVQVEVGSNRTLRLVGSGSRELNMHELVDRIRAKGVQLTEP